MYSRLYFSGTKVPVPISDGCVQPPDRNHLILDVILLLAMVVNYQPGSEFTNSHVSLAGTVVIINPPYYRLLKRKRKEKYQLPNVFGIDSGLKWRQFTMLDLRQIRVSRGHLPTLTL